MKKEAIKKLIKAHFGGHPSKTSSIILKNIYEELIKSGGKPPFVINNIKTSQTKNIEDIQNINMEETEKIDSIEVEIAAMGNLIPAELNPSTGKLSITNFQGRIEAYIDNTSLPKEIQRYLIQISKENFNDNLPGTMSFEDQTTMGEGPEERIIYFNLRPDIKIVFPTEWADDLSKLPGKAKFPEVAQEVASEAEQYGGISIQQ